MSAKKDVAIFDLCGVLIDCNTRYAYENEIKDENRLNYFLTNVCNETFMRSFDEGRNLKDAVALWVQKFPEYAVEISDFPRVCYKMFNGEIKENVELVRKIKNKGIRVFVLSNCSHEHVPMIRENFKSLDLFDGCVFSGIAKAAKPKAEIFNYLLTKYNIDAARAVFVDDNPANVAKAQELGIDSVLFTTPAKLAQDLKPRFFARP